MPASHLHDIARRLIVNVETGRGDFADDVLRVPSAHYRDRQRYERELEMVFRRSPSLVALSCDVRETGEYSTITLAGRPLLILRGDDGVARAFLNICRHRGAQVANECFGRSRRLTCPYHSWVYDTRGRLAFNTAADAFEGVDIDGLIELPCAERVGGIWVIPTPGVALDIDDWLGDMQSALAQLDLNSLIRHRDGLPADSGNWKASADGYVDGYHLGYLHGSSIGTKSITNRNTYDLYGPHVRLGFSNKPIVELRDTPVEQWNLRDAMSLVHYVFPNVSISGLPDAKGLMLSRIYPGETADRCVIEQFQYFREPMDTPEKRAEADTKRDMYYQVTKDEDFFTVLQVTTAAAAADGGDFVFGRNELGNQNLHRWVDKLIGEPA